MNESKYRINQQVFFLEREKIECKRVTGIVVLFNEKSYSAFKGSTQTFKRFEYNFDCETSPSRYSWIPESRIFKTKEELLASL